MKRFVFQLCVALFLGVIICASSINAQETAAALPLPESAAAQTDAAQALPQAAVEIVDRGYLVGIDDILEISIISPDPMELTVTVSPDGGITFPYIGSVTAQGRTLAQLQEEITARLTQGYMRYPVVNVVLKESRSRRFFVYGEVVRPGAYPLEGNATVMRAISIAGGFTKFGSSSRIKVLRPRDGNAGYEPLKINIKDILNGSPSADITLKSGDIVVVSEGMF